MASDNLFDNISYILRYVDGNLTENKRRVEYYKTNKEITLDCGVNLIKKEESVIDCPHGGLIYRFHYDTSLGENHGNCKYIFCRICLLNINKTYLVNIYGNSAYKSVVDSIYRDGNE